MNQAANSFTTPTDAGAIAPEVRRLLSPFFPKWRGEASEPAISEPTPKRPAPAARALVLA